MKVIITMMVFCIFGSVHASLKISTYNIRMFGRTGENTNLLKLKEIISDVDANLIGVQEIVSATKFKSFIESNFKNYAVSLSTCGGGGKQKLGFVYDKTRLELVNFVEDDSISSPKGTDLEPSPDRCSGSLRPLIIGTFKDLNTKKNIVAMVVHLKAGGSETSYRKRAQQYLALKSIYKKYEAKFENIVMLGDFNTTGYNDRTVDYDRFMDMITTVDVFDSAEKISCTSYWSGSSWDDNIEEPSILDHILISKEMRKSAKLQFTVGTHCKKVSCKEANYFELGESYHNVSDHCPVSVTFL